MYGKICEQIVDVLVPQFRKLTGLKLFFSPRDSVEDHRRGVGSWGHVRDRAP